MAIINSRADLERLRGTPDFARAMKQLHGSLVSWTLDNGEWVEEEDLSTIEAFGFTKAGFLEEAAPFNFAPPSPPGPRPAPSAAVVDEERDRRINAGMAWDGVTYQTRPQDRENVAGAATLALASIVNGAQPGDLRWNGGDADFAWIAEDNSTHTFDAQTFFAFAQAMAQHKSAHIFAARAIKDMDPIPADYADDRYWP